MHKLIRFAISLVIVLGLAASLSASAEEVTPREIIVEPQPWESIESHFPSRRPVAYVQGKLIVEDTEGLFVHNVETKEDVKIPVEGGKFVHSRDKRYIYIQGTNYLYLYDVLENRTTKLPEIPKAEQVFGLNRFYVDKYLITTDYFDTSFSTNYRLKTQKIPEIPGDEVLKKFQEGKLSAIYLYTKYDLETGKRVEAFYCSPPMLHPIETTIIGFNPYTYILVISERESNKLTFYNVMSKESKSISIEKYFSGDKPFSIRSFPKQMMVGDIERVIQVSNELKVVGKVLGDVFRHKILQLSQFRYLLLDSCISILDFEEGKVSKVHNESIPVSSVEVDLIDGMKFVFANQWGDLVQFSISSFETRILEVFSYAPSNRKYCNSGGRLFIPCDEGRKLKVFSPDEKRYLDDIEFKGKKLVDFTRCADSWKNLGIIFEDGSFEVIDAISSDMVVRKQLFDKIPPSFQYVQIAFSSTHVAVQYDKHSAMLFDLQTEEKSVVSNPAFEFSRRLVPGESFLRYVDKRDCGAVDVNAFKRLYPFKCSKNEEVFPELQNGESGPYFWDIDVSQEGKAIFRSTCLYDNTEKEYEFSRSLFPTGEKHLRMHTLQLVGNYLFLNCWVNEYTRSYILDLTELKVHEIQLPEEYKGKSISVSMVQAIAVERVLIHFQVTEMEFDENNYEVLPYFYAIINLKSLK